VFAQDLDQVVVLRRRDTAESGAVLVSSLDLVSLDGDLADVVAFHACHKFAEIDLGAGGIGRLEKTP